VSLGASRWPPQIVIRYTCIDPLRDSTSKLPPYASSITKPKSRKRKWLGFILAVLILGLFPYVVEFILVHFVHD
jgi:hypothetical protein